MLAKLFGSRARGTAGADSDWDFVISDPGLLDRIPFPLPEAMMADEPEGHHRAVNAWSVSAYNALGGAEGIAQLKLEVIAQHEFGGPKPTPLLVDILLHVPPDRDPRVWAIQLDLRDKLAKWDCCTMGMIAKGFSPLPLLWPEAVLRLLDAVKPKQHADVVEAWLRENNGGIPDWYQRYPSMALVERADRKTAQSISATGMK